VWWATEIDLLVPFDNSLSDAKVSIGNLLGMFGRLKGWLKPGSGKYLIINTLWIICSCLLLMIILTACKIRWSTGHRICSMEMTIYVLYATDFEQSVKQLVLCWTDYLMVATTTMQTAKKKILMQYMVRYFYMCCLVFNYVFLG